MNIIRKYTKTKSIDNYKPKKDKSLQFLTLAVLGLFIGTFLCIGFYSYTLISFYSFSKFLISFAIVGFLVPLKYYQKWFDFIKYEMIIFNIIGVAPLFAGLFLLLNFIFVFNTTTCDYKVEKLYFDEGHFKGVVLENNAFAKERKIVGFPNSQQNEIIGKNILRLTLAEGLFGFEVIKKRELRY